MFEGSSNKESALKVWLKRLGLLAVAFCLSIGFIAAYRAWFQVKSLDLRLVAAPEAPIITNSTEVETTVVSYARTTVDVHLELIQGTHAETLAVQQVPGNHWAFFDPRTRQASQRISIDRQILDRFSVGRAQVRATAVGREQWTRLPPPMVRELAVEIRRN